MKNRVSTIVLGISLLLSFNGIAANLWRQTDINSAPVKLQVMHPTQFLVYTLDEATMKLQLWNLANDPAEGIVITLPLPDGSYRDFKVWQTSMMPTELAAKYRDIKTFTAEATDDHTVTAKIDFTG